MVYPDITAFYAALLALLFLALSAWVVFGRVGSGVLFGEGEDALRRRVRSHGNFAEYVPLVLLMVGWLEMGHTSRFVIHALLLPLLVARLLHPVGMLARENSPMQFACRGGGIIVTLLVMAASAILLLLHGA